MTPEIAKILVDGAESCFLIWALVKGVALFINLIVHVAGRR